MATDFVTIPLGLVPSRDAILTNEVMSKAIFAARLEAWALNYGGDYGPRYQELTEFLAKVEGL